jgi:GAF domain-containing protein
VAHLRHLIPCRRVGITLFDWTAGEALLLAIDLDAQTGEVPPGGGVLQPGTGLQPGTRMPLDPFADVIAAGRQGKVAVVTRLESRGWVGEALVTEGNHSLVSVPLLSQDTLIGSINFSLGASDPRAFARQWEAVARQVADQLVIGIQQARLYEQVQRHAEDLEQRVAARTRELAAFFDLATLTARGRDMSELLEPALTRIMDVAYCQALCVHLLDGEGRTLQLVSQRNLPDEARQHLGRVAVEDDFLRRTRQPGDPIVVTDLAEPSLLPDPLRLEAFSSYLGVPLRAGEHPLG